MKEIKRKIEYVKKLHELFPSDPGVQMKFVDELRQLVDKKGVVLDKSRWLRKARMALVPFLSDGNQKIIDMYAVLIIDELIFLEDNSAAFLKLIRQVMNDGTVEMLMQHPSKEVGAMLIQIVDRYSTVEWSVSIKNDEDCFYFEKAWRVIRGLMRNKQQFQLTSNRENSLNRLLPDVELVLWEYYSSLVVKNDNPSLSILLKYIIVLRQLSPQRLEELGGLYEESATLSGKKKKKQKKKEKKKQKKELKWELFKQHMDQGGWAGLLKEAQKKYIDLLNQKMAGMNLNEAYDIWEDMVEAFLEIEEQELKDVLKEPMKQVFQLYVTCLKDAIENKRIEDIDALESMHAVLRQYDKLETGNFKQGFQESVVQIVRMYIEVLGRMQLDDKKDQDFLTTMRLFKDRLQNNGQDVSKLLESSFFMIFNNHSRVSFHHAEKILAQQA